MRTIKQINTDLKRISDEFREKHNALLAEKVEAIKNGHTYTGVPFHLHALILRFTDQDFIPGCGCQDMMSRMEDWGPAGCREHLEEIVDKMMKEGQKRGWKLKIASKLPLARSVARRMVLLAIKRAEKEQSHV